MDYKTLVVQAEDDGDGRNRIELGLALAVRFHATLVGVAVRDLIPLMTVPSASPGIGTLLAAEEEEIREGLEAAERQFRALAAATQARIAWRSMIADPAETLAREARTADLIVVGRRPERVGTSWSRHADPGDVLMQAGRPILVVPPWLVVARHGSCCGCLER